MNGKPLRSPAIDGSRPTGNLRIRPSLFGFCVVEELIEYSDGRKVWEKIRWAKELPAASNRSAG